MEKAKFTAILPFICADLANMISKEEMLMVLRQLDILLQKIYKGEFEQYKKDVER